MEDGKRLLDLSQKSIEKISIKDEDHDAVVLKVVECQKK
jgi:hypothetical protein